MSKKKGGTEARKLPSQERGRHTVEAILKATVKALKSEGYESMTTNRIAAVAGVSVGTLYEYFPGKEAIVATLVEQNMARVEAVVSDAIRQYAGGPLVASIRGIIAALFDANKLDKELGSLLRDLIPLVGKLAALNDQHRRFAAFVAMDLATRKNLRTTDLDLAALIVVKLADTMSNAFSAHNKALPQEQGARELVDVIHLYLTGEPAAE